VLDLKQHLVTIDTGSKGAVATTFAWSPRDAFLKSKIDGSGAGLFMTDDVTARGYTVHSFDLGRAAKYDGLAEKFGDIIPPDKVAMQGRLIEDIIEAYAALPYGLPLVFVYEYVEFVASTLAALRLGEYRGVIQERAFNLGHAHDGVDVSKLKSYIFAGFPTGSKRDAAATEKAVNKWRALSTKVRNDDEATAVALMRYYCEHSNA